jgi:hypothetical protein
MLIPPIQRREAPSWLNAARTSIARRLAGQAIGQRAHEQDIWINQTRSMGFTSARNAPRFVAFGLDDRLVDHCGASEGRESVSKRRRKNQAVDLSQLAEFAATLERERQEQQRQHRKRQWWVAAAAALSTALVAGILAVVTDTAAIPGRALRISEQVGPMIEEAVGPDAIDVVAVHRLPGSTGHVLLPADPASRDAALEDPLRNGSTMAEWKDKFDLVAAGSVTWEIVLQTYRDERIEITNMMPALEGGRCGGPLTGSLLFNDSAGEIGKIALAIEIDSERPVFMAQFDRSSPWVPYFQHRQIGLEKGKKETILLTASANSGHCRWHIRADYYAAGSKRSQMLGRPDGKPLEVTAVTSCDQYDLIVPDILLCMCSKPQPMSSSEYTADGRRCTR